MFWFLVLDALYWTPQRDSSYHFTNEPGMRNLTDRKDSAIAALVQETLVLAKAHGYVEKIEEELEQELKRDHRALPKERVARWRHKGAQTLHSKHMLLVVVALCMVDCALVLGELILDLHNVKNTLQRSEAVTSRFINQLKEKYPDYLDESQDVDMVYHRVLGAEIIWIDSSHRSNQTYSHSSTKNISRHRRKATSKRNSDFENSGPPDIYSDIPTTLKYSNNHDNASVHFRNDHSGGKSHSIEEEVGHALHLASITILAILTFETILKIICSGTTFFHRRLETFDAGIVIVSFIVDLVFVKGTSIYKIEEFVFVLAFLLPWRVLRVVNSLVVAVKDHEHFRLKLVYSRKKKMQTTMRHMEVEMGSLKHQVSALKQLCMENIGEWKKRQVAEKSKTSERRRVSFGVINEHDHEHDGPVPFAKFSPHKAKYNLNNGSTSSHSSKDIEEECRIVPKSLTRQFELDSESVHSDIIADANINSASTVKYMQKAHTYAGETHSEPCLEDEVEHDIP